MIGLERLRRPECTGRNRCLACIAVIPGILLVLTAVARFRPVAVETSRRDCCGHTVPDPDSEPPTALDCEPCDVAFYQFE